MEDNLGHLNARVDEVTMSTQESRRDLILISFQTSLDGIEIIQTCCQSCIANIVDLDDLMRIRTEVSLRAFPIICTTLISTASPGLLQAFALIRGSANLEAFFDFSPPCLE